MMISSSLVTDVYPPMASFKYLFPPSLCSFSHLHCVQFWRPPTSFPHHRQSLPNHLPNLNFPAPHPCYNAVAHRGMCLCVRVCIMVGLWQWFPVVVACRDKSAKTIVIATGWHTHIVPCVWKDALTPTHILHIYTHTAQEYSLLCIPTIHLHIQVYTSSIFKSQFLY